MVSRQIIDFLHEKYHLSLFNQSNSIWENKICCFSMNSLTLCLLSNISCFCHLLIIFEFIFILVIFFRNIINVSNSLDQDHARRFVWHDLGLDCLQRLSADDTSTVVNEDNSSKLGSG